MAQDKQTGPRPGGRAHGVLRAGQLLWGPCRPAWFARRLIASGAEPSAHHWI